MRNHTLMQTIARANRVAPGKKAGIIVDYVGIFRDLQKALAIYAKPGDPNDLPIKDKSALVEELKSQLAACYEFCGGRGVDIDRIIKAEAAFDRVALIDNAVDALVAVAVDKKEYLQMASRIARLFKAILPDAEAHEAAPAVVLISFIAAKIRALTPTPDISQVENDIEQLLNDSIATESYRIKAPSAGALGRPLKDRLRCLTAKVCNRCQAHRN